LDRVQATGADSLTLAASYHQSRDVFPHNPHGVTQYLSSGSSAFRPTTERYGLLHPAPGDGRRDLLADLVDATTARGMTAQAWVVLLHNSRLGRAHPEVTVHNALGDRLRHALCPAHPEVRRYVTALATDLAEHGVTAIHLEALTAGGYDHGETHERALIYLGETARFLLGLCFCPHCRAAGHAQDVDVDVLAARIHGVLTEVLQSHDYAAALPPLTPDTLGELLGSPSSPTSPPAPAPSPPWPRRWRPPSTPSPRRPESCSSTPPAPRSAMPRAGRRRAHPQRAWHGAKDWTLPTSPSTWTSVPSATSPIPTGCGRRSSPTPRPSGPAGDWLPCCARRGRTPPPRTRCPPTCAP